MKNTSSAPTESTGASPQREYRIVTRLPWLYAFVAFLFAGLFLFATVMILKAPVKSNAEIACAVFICPLFIGITAFALWGGCYVADKVVVANEQGLRWRLWDRWRPRREWQSCLWEEVADFYYEAGGRAGSLTGGIRIETRDGRLLTVGSDWSNGAPFAEYLAEKAAHVEAARRLDGTPAVLWRGIRPADLPRTFEYDSDYLRGKRRAAIIGNTCFAGFFILFLGIMMVLALTQAPKTESPIVFVVAFSALMLTFVTLGVLQARKECHQIDMALGLSAEGQKVTATRDGLRFHRDGESGFVPWESVFGWEFIGPQKSNVTDLIHGKIRIRVVGGREETVSRLINHAELLPALLKEYATEGVEYRLNANAANAIGGVATRWSGGEEGKGARVFRALTKASLGVFVIFLCQPTLFGSLVLRHWLRYHMLDGLEPILIVVALLTALPFVYLTAILKGRIEADAKGLAQVRLRGRQTILWDEVTRFRVDGTNFVETDDGRRIEFASTSYAYGSELQTLIAEQIARARAAKER